MSTSPFPLPVGTICRVVPFITSTNDYDLDEFEIVEIMSTRWDPINDDNWRVRHLETGKESRVWGFYLRPVSPLELLACQSH